jgi:hypothetical protein
MSGCRGSFISNCRDWMVGRVVRFALCLISDYSSVKAHVTEILNGFAKFYSTVDKVAFLIRIWHGISSSIVRF